MALGFFFEKSTDVRRPTSEASTEEDTLRSTENPPKRSQFLFHLSHRIYFATWQGSI